MKKYITQKELCETLEVSQATVKRWRDKGMPYIRMSYNVVRYDYDEVMKWLKGRSDEFI